MIAARWRSYANNETIATVEHPACKQLSSSCPWIFILYTFNAKNAAFLRFSQCCQCRFNAGVKIHCALLCINLKCAVAQLIIFSYFGLFQSPEGQVQYGHRTVQYGKLHLRLEQDVFVNEISYRKPAAEKLVTVTASRAYVLLVDSLLLLLIKGDDFLSGCPSLHVCTPLSQM